MGIITRFMRATGAMTNGMGTGESSGIMVITTRESSKTILTMDKAKVLIAMEQSKRVGLNMVSLRSELKVS